MIKNLLVLCSAFIILTSCNKQVETPLTNKETQPATDVANTPATTTTTTPTTPVTDTDFVKYTIAQGSQYCDKNSFTPVSYEQLSFVVKFDSSAIYSTILLSNQNDINKLFGFSDNSAQHHEFSARIGWRWSNNALRLFAYIYNNSVMSAQEISTIKIGEKNNCSIKVRGNKYIFSVNETTIEMPRSSTTVKGDGYKLYPYFGGDEFAPHTISIWIKENK